MGIDLLMPLIGLPNRHGKVWEIRNEVKRFHIINRLIYTASV